MTNVYREQQCDEVTGNMNVGEEIRNKINAVLQACLQVASINQNKDAVMSCDCTGVETGRRTANKQALFAVQCDHRV